jgi:peptidoglycan/xylan/chitin deacetylase (PgdA/CDA1 family)
MTHSLFVISLDFELHWGVRDRLSVDAYRENLLGARTAVLALLDEFSRRNLHATWAVVGMLFARNREELTRLLPDRIPRYANPALSPYSSLNELGPDEEADPFHYAASLISRIAATAGQELATHTFSHFYCLEPGQTRADFAADLAAARRAGASHGETCRSIVFPRNQINTDYFSVLREAGVVAVRTNPKPWFYQPGREHLARKAIRLADAYLPLTDRSALLDPVADTLIPVPASAFLRPCGPSERLERVRLARLRREMTHAARAGRLFHLWWHPHNFGRRMPENLRFLGHVLDHFETLRDRYDMRSATMFEAASAIRALSRGGQC